jgi:hypothetical protein
VFGPVNGTYRITEKEYGTYDLDMYNGTIYENYKGTFYKILASGHKDYDEIYVYYQANEVIDVSGLFVFFYNRGSFVQLYIFSGS